MNPRYWRMPEGGGGVIETPQDQLEYYNTQGFGIFWTWNEYDGNRSHENLKKINAWAIDIDGGDKESQHDMIIKSPLVPSMIRESKNGFHIYFYAKTATIKNYKKIMIGLQSFFGADKKALDAARILRLDGYYHLKNINDPFLIKNVFQRNIFYDEAEMIEAFAEKQIVRNYFEDQSTFKSISKNGSDLWDKVYEMDCMTELQKLSGNQIVNYEKFTFEKQRNGNHNIFVNGKSTSCFIDKAGRIGSSDGGGPTIYRWILWYTKDKKKTIEFMKLFYPELGW